MAERHDLALALQQVTSDGLTRTTFRDLKQGVDATAARLAALGVSKGDRVVLAAQNHPDWAIAYFGIVRAGATAVPIDPGLDARAWGAILAESEARAVVWDDAVAAREEVAASSPSLLALDLRSITQVPLPSLEAPLVAPAITVEPGDVASLIYTSGTTARPKGVMLTHANFTSLVAALAPIFPLSRGDAALSVLPLHHTFEFTCGLLLPLSRGARVVYVGELHGRRDRRGPPRGAGHGHGRRACALAAPRAANSAAGRRPGPAGTRRVRRRGRSEPLAVGKPGNRRRARPLRRRARAARRPHEVAHLRAAPRSRARRRSSSSGSASR